MKSPRDTVVRVLIVPACLALWAGAAVAQSAGSAPISEQLSIQESIYHTRGRDTPPGYIIDRSLFSYADTLPPEFGRELAALGPGDRWLDIGAGQGRAILEYYIPEKLLSDEDERKWRASRARSVGISIEDRRTYRWHQAAKSLEPGQIQYLAGKRLREYTPEELGRFQIITDIGGGFSYTSYLSEFTEKALSALAPNGRFYAVLQNVHCEKGPDQPYYAGSPFLTEIEKSSRSKVKICSWLKSISCVKVRCQRNTEWDPPIEVYRVEKVCDDIKVPRLVRVHFQAGTPPERRFQLADPFPPADRDAAAN